MNSISKVKMGLAARLIIAVSSLMIVTIVIVSLVNVRTQQALLLEKTLLHVHVISSLLRESSINYLDDFNVGKLRLLMADVARDPNVTYCYVFDDTGTILTDGTVDNLLRDQRLTDPVSLNSIAATETLQQINQNIVDVTSPIYLGKVKLGGVRIGFSLAQLAQEEQQIILKNIQLAVLFFFIALIVLFWLAKQITKPLHTLTRTIADFDIYDNKPLTGIRSEDEIGALSQEFDNLIVKLRRTMASKDQLDLEVCQRIEVEKELREAVLQANSAVEAKSAFLANMSHEIRTPMNGVLGMLGLLLNTPLNPEQTHRANVAKLSADSLLTVINDILDFSKIDAGKLEFESFDFNLHTLVGNFAEVMAVQAGQKNIELILDLAHIKYSMIKSDPDRIRQILTNILGNAIKFTEQGEIVIAIELVPIAGETQRNKLRLCCSITDTGIGIAKEKQDLLFDAFSQADTSTTRQYGGTGLGLSITKRLCQLMGGDIRVSSEVGQGSCFTFELLVDEGEESTPMMPEIDISALQILIVDDNATNREVLRGQLNHWGAAVIEADSGESALQACQQRLDCPEQRFFDVALLDMQMPGMDGALLGLKIREIKAYQTMKLVMMTSMGERGDAQYLAKIGFHGYFPKPTTTADLLNTLKIVADDGDALHQANPLVTQQYLRSMQSTRAEEDFNPQIVKNTRILLVEDNKVNQMVASGILAEFGFHIDVVDNGLQALDRLNSALNDTAYSLIFMDCQMPVMDGFEATRRIRQGDAGMANTKVPIIAMTANAMQGDREKCIASGMNDYLSKPLVAKKLLLKIKIWLQELDTGPLAVTQSGHAPADMDTTNSKDKETNITAAAMDYKPSLADDNADQIWDKHALIARVMGDQALTSELLQVYIEDMPGQLAQIQLAVDSNNCEQLMQLAHAIKGVAASLSGIELSVVAAELERAAKAKELQVLGEINRQLVSAHQLLQLQFERYLNAI
jgi:two-component system sensor histidine kinase/response regulator